MRNKKRKEEKLLKERAELVRAAMGLGYTTRKEIAESAGITMVQLSNLFQKNRALFAEYKVLRRTITDIASDNIFNIVNDPTHPQHFAASKYVLANYKNDLDDTLDAADGAGLVIDPSGESKSPVKIVFSRSNKTE